MTARAGAAVIHVMLHRRGMAGAAVGAAAGTAVGAAVVTWTQKNIEKWQKQVNESDRIVDLITDKIGDM